MTTNKFELSLESFDLPWSEDILDSECWEWVDDVLSTPSTYYEANPDDEALEDTVVLDLISYDVDVDDLDC